MMMALSKVVMTISVMAQAWAVMTLFFVCVMAFKSSFVLLQPCGHFEGGVKLGGNVCSIEHFLPIFVKVVKITKINFLF
jgi:hypothetical protein